MDTGVSFYGSRVLVEDAARDGRLENCQIAGCDLAGMEFRGRVWDGVTLRDLHAPRLVFENASVHGSAFFRCNLTGLDFSASVMDGVILDGLVLIRGLWRKSKLKNVRLRGSCLQRAEFSRVRASGSSFTDFEAIESRVESCVFSGCVFRLSYGSGMNGFSGARLTNCIFSGCRFEGFPLRGAVPENCLFIGSSGQPGCEESPRGKRYAQFFRGEEARALVTRFA